MSKKISNCDVLGKVGKRYLLNGMWYQAFELVNGEYHHVVVPHAYLTSQQKERLSITIVMPQFSIKKRIKQIKL